MSRVIGDEGAELARRRDLLGASTDNMACLLGYSRKQSYTKWERGGSGEVPQHVWDEIERLERWRDATINAILAQTKKWRDEYGQPQAVDLPRWRRPDSYAANVTDAQLVPFGVYTRTIGLAVDALLDAGFDVNLTWSENAPHEN